MLHEKKIDMDCKLLDFFRSFRLKTSINEHDLKGQIFKSFLIAVINYKLRYQFLADLKKYNVLDWLLK